MGNEPKQAQAKSSAPNVKEPITIISRPFYLKYMEAEYLQPYDKEVGEYQKLVDTQMTPYSNDSVAIPISRVDLIPKPVTSRWVYVLQWLGDKITWYGEYWFNEKGDFSAVDMNKARNVERSKRPEPAGSLNGVMALPHTINGKRAYYAFYVSGTRLALASIQKLASEEVWRMIHGVDLSVESTFQYYNASFGTSDADKPLVGPGEIGYVVVMDPLRYCASLNRVMQQLRDRAVTWVSPAKDMTDKTQIARIKKRQKKKLLAEIIDAVLMSDTDHSLRKKLKGDNPVYNGQQVYEYIRDYNTKLEYKLKDVDTVAKNLTDLLGSKLMTFIASTYMILEDVDIVPFQQTDFPGFLIEYALCTDRLSESGPGKDFLLAVQKDNGHFSHQFLTSAPPSGPKIQAWRKSYAAGFSLWKELLMVALDERNGITVEHMVEALNNAGHIPLLKVEFQKGDFVFRREEGIPKTRPHDYASVEVEKEGAVWITTPHRYTHITIQPEGRAGITREKLTGALTHVMAAVEAYNLGLALLEFQKANGTGDKIWATVGVLGSAMDTVPAFNILLRLEEMTVKKISFISAIIDTVTALRDASSSSGRGDAGGTIGYGTVAAGSALVALGCAAAMIGGETLWAGVGVVLEVVGAVLVAAGWLISWLTKDSDMETLMAHCSWGVRHGEDSGSEAWSDGTFEDWQEDKPHGLDHQVIAALNLAAGFSIHPGSMGSGYTTVSIDLGMTQPESKLYIKFQTQYNKIAHNPIYIVDMLNRTFSLDKQHQSDPADLSPSRLGVWKNKAGGMIVSVEAHFALDDPDYQYAIQIQNCDCEVRLDLYGNGIRWIPSSGAWVPLHIKALNEMAHFDRVVSSTDY